MHECGQCDKVNSIGNLPYTVTRNEGNSQLSCKRKCDNHKKEVQYFRQMSCYSNINIDPVQLAQAYA